MSHARRVGAVLVAVVALVTGVGLAAAPAGAGAPDYCYPDPNDQFVCDSYASFFRREPSQAELDYWAPSVPGRKTYFLATLGRAAESRRRIIETYYAYFIDHEAGEGEVAYWEGEVLEPNGFRRLEAALLGSYVGTIDGYLEWTFDRLLDRSPSEQEATYWGTRVTQTSRNLVAADLAFTSEARNLRVRWTYKNELGYFPGDAGRDYWAGRLRAGTSFLDLRIALKASPDGYPDGSRFCSPLAPVLTDTCEL